MKTLKRGWLTETINKRQFMFLLFFLFYLYWFKYFSIFLRSFVKTSASVFMTFTIEIIKQIFSYQRKIFSRLQNFLLDFPSREQGDFFLKSFHDFSFSICLESLDNYSSVHPNIVSHPTTHGSPNLQILSHNFHKTCDFKKS